MLYIYFFLHVLFFTGNLILEYWKCITEELVNLLSSFLGSPIIHWQGLQRVFKRQYTYLDVILLVNILFYSIQIQRPDMFIIYVYIYLFIWGCYRFFDVNFCFMLKRSKHLAMPLYAHWTLYRHYKRQSSL